MMILGQIFPDLTGDYVFSSAVIIPVITALVQAIKSVGVRDKWAPLISIAIGVLIAVFLRPDTEEVTHAVFTGILYGLSASGLYSGIVHTLGTNNHGNGTVVK